MTRYDELDALDTDELKDRAMEIARDRGDVAFVWDVIKHLPQSPEVANEDGASGGMLTTIAGLLGMFEELFGKQMHEAGAVEPLLRARFIDYIVKHEDG